MTEPRARRGRPPPKPAQRETEPDQADSERALGRIVSLGLPVVSVGAAVTVGALAGVGSGLLVLAAGALLGTIALLWASVRTLSGDAPLGAGFESLSATRHGLSSLGEEKQRLLRALKDIEAEREIGKIDEADYAEVVARYRADAKAVMRMMDAEIAPRRAEAERLVSEYLARRASGAEGVDSTRAADSAGARDERRQCPRCSTSNERDAAFCKQCGASMAGEAPSDASR